MVKNDSRRSFEPKRTVIGHSRLSTESGRFSRISLNAEVEGTKVDGLFPLDRQFFDFRTVHLCRPFTLSLLDRPV